MTALKGLEYTKDQAVYDEFETKWTREFSGEPQIYEYLAFALIKIATSDRAQWPPEITRRVISIRRRGMEIFEKAHPDRPTLRSLGFPLRGPVQIWNEFNDEVWSHVGLQGKYCYDMGNIGEKGVLLEGRSGRANEDFETFGRPLYAVLDGVVKQAADETQDQPPGRLNGGGNNLWIEHAGGYKSYYDHIKFRSLKVKTGDRVRRGQIVAAVGNTGASSQPHLHFCMFDQENVTLAYSFKKHQVTREDSITLYSGGPYRRGWKILARD
jgi:hypothetical protein